MFKPLKVKYFQMTKILHLREVLNIFSRKFKLGEDEIIKRIRFKFDCRLWRNWNNLKQ